METLAPLISCQTQLNTLTAMLRDTADLMSRVHYADYGSELSAQIQVEAIRELLTPVT